MTRFLIAAVAAVALGLVSADKADAQIVYGYNVPRGGGVVSGATVLAPGGYQTYNSYFSPFTGVMYNQTYYTDVFGQRYGRAYGYNPWTGLSYQQGFYQPNYYAFPYGGYSNYSFFRPW